MGLIEQLLDGGDGSESALDVDVEALGQPEARPSVGRGERRLTAFDVGDDRAEDRAHLRRQVLGVAAVALGSLAALAGSVAVGL